MANVLYAKAKEGFLGGAVNWSTDNIKAVLVNSGSYTVDAANHTNLSQIPGGARIATSAANLSNKTVTGGVADADDVLFSAVSSASIVNALALYKDTGVEATSTLIAYLDTGTGLPITPNGGDITVVWAATANKIFTL